MTTEEIVRRCFNKGCVDYSLLEDGDKILVALSGGKDSLMLSRLLALRSRIYKPSIKVAAAHVVMDNIPYETDLSYLENFCKQENIELNVIHSHFDESTDRRKTKCFLCAWNRRKALFNFAKENGFNKIALGHHQDDILTTWVMNMTFEGNTFTMLPKVEMEHYPVEIIRPLCLVKEEWIKELSSLYGFIGQKRKCPYETVSRRSEMQAVLNTLLAMHDDARKSLWKAMMKE